MGHIQYANTIVHFPFLYTLYQNPNGTLKRLYVNTMLPRGMYVVSKLNQCITIIILNTQCISHSNMHAYDI